MKVSPAILSALRATATGALRDVVRCNRLAKAASTEPQRNMWTWIAKLYMADRLELEDTIARLS